MARTSPPLKKVRTRVKEPETDNRVVIDPQLVESLERMAEERGISVPMLINVRLTAMVNAYNNFRTLGLDDSMPFGKYRGIRVEDMIRADARYVAWLYQESDIFELDDSARVLLEELS